MTINTLEVHKDSGEWVSMNASEETLDLKTLTENPRFLASHEFDAGQYNQVRFKIKSVHLVTENQEYDAVITRESIALVGTFEIVNGQTTVVTIDVDTTKSLVLQDDGKYIFRPSIHVLLPSPSGALNIASVSPDNGEVGVPYRMNFHATGGRGPYTWSITSGTLPPRAIA